VEEANKTKYTVVGITKELALIIALFEKKLRRQFRGATALGFKAVLSRATSIQNRMVKELSLFKVFENGLMTPPSGSLPPRWTAPLLLRASVALPRRSFSRPFARRNKRCVT